MKQAILLLPLLLASCSLPAEPLPRIAELPSFRLTGVTAGGKPFPVEKRDLLKKPFVASFLYTNCGGPCPMLALKLGRLQKDLGGAARIVTVTVDPEHDTPAVLSSYAQEVDAGPDWWFLTGKKKDVSALVVEGFKLARAEDPTKPVSDRVAHSTKLALVDSACYVRGYYDSNEPAEVRKLLADLKNL